MNKLIALTTFALLLALNIVESQELVMQNGTFNACEPQIFTDTGGASGPYQSNEDFVMTICPENSGDILVFSFGRFSTQANQDVLKIYNGEDINAPLIGEYSGSTGPGTVTSSNPTGCLTFTFTSNGSGNTLGWEAFIFCTTPCQGISPTITNTDPAPNGAGDITIIPGITVEFNGDATFSDSGNGATYSWDFGNGNSAEGQSVQHQFVNPGFYVVTLPVKDANPLGCEESTTLNVIVGPPIITVNNSGFPESGLALDELVEEVLVTGGCSEVENFAVQSAGNPDDFLTKSYGFFTRGSAIDFPFEEGIILSTGRAAQAGNIRTPDIIQAQNGLSGDNDLETALNINSTFDATSVKFDFTPTSNSIRFRYFMASEEYDGSTECSFADSFAFLLRRKGTALYENLAVLPGGTPVSVTNINDSNICRSNPEFFAGYNIGDSNFGGRTEILIAEANVEPGTAGAAGET